MIWFLTIIFIFTMFFAHIPFCAYPEFFDVTPTNRTIIIQKILLTIQIFSFAAYICQALFYMYLSIKTAL